MIRQGVKASFGFARQGVRRTSTNGAKKVGGRIRGGFGVPRGANTNRSGGLGFAPSSMKQARNTLYIAAQRLQDATIESNTGIACILGNIPVIKIESVGGVEVEPEEEEEEGGRIRRARMLLT